MTPAERTKKWCQDNKERRKRYNKSNKFRYIVYKNHAKLRGLIFDITLEEFEVFVSLCCHYCGKPGYGIDRLNSAMGYIKGNMVPCCSMCNWMKKDYSYEEFIEQCRLIILNLK